MMEIFERDFQIFTYEKVGTEKIGIFIINYPWKNGIFIIEKVLKIGMNLLLTYYKFIIKYLANFFTSLLRAPEKWRFIIKLMIFGVINKLLTTINKLLTNARKNFYLAFWGTMGEKYV